MVIASIVVNCTSDQFEEIKKWIGKKNELEIVQTMDQKIAVVIEADSTESVAVISEEINSLNGVTSVEIVSHFFEDEIFNSSDIPN